MTYLISLISDHLLPNYLLIKEMEGKYDKLLFITTTKMRGSGKGTCMEKALGLKDNSVRRIEVSEEDLNEMIAKLESEHFDTNDRFIVNLTCGTKIMSIGVYEFFSRFTSSFYYVPIGKNKIENVRTSEDIPLNYRVNLKEYFDLYGLTYVCNDSLYYPPEHTMDLYERFKKVYFNRKNIPEIQNAKSFETEEDQRYYSGVWFEEYTYLRIKEEKKLQDDFICTGAKIYRPNSGTLNDNEIDVMFVLDNKLYIGECKVSMIGTPELGGTHLLEQFMYKLAAISKDFGLIVNSYIFTLHNFNRVSPNRMAAIEKRMNILGIKGILESSAFRQNTLII